MSDPLVIAGREFQSRLIIGTGKFKDYAENAAALGRGSGAEPHRLRRLGDSGRSGTGTAAGNDLPRHHRRSPGAPHGRSAFGTDDRSAYPAGHAGPLLDGPEELILR